MYMFRKVLLACFASIFSLSTMAATKVQFALDWKFEGPSAPYFLARYGRRYLRYAKFGSGRMRFWCL